MNKQMDRRALFATGSAAAVLAALGMSADAQPVHGGALTAALSGKDRNETWSATPGSHFLRAVRTAVFDTLTEIAPDGTLQPRLATSWRSEAGGSVWHLALREYVFFHDGSPLTAEDVAATLRHAGFDACICDGVRVRLTEPDHSFPIRLAQDHLIVSRAKDLADTCPNLNGTGLYRAERFDPGRGFLGKRVAAHFRDGQAGWFDTVELISTSDVAVRIDAVQKGIVQMADLSGMISQPVASDLVECRAVSGCDALVSSSIMHRAQIGKGALDDMRFHERWWSKPV